MSVNIAALIGFICALCLSWLTLKSLRWHQRFSLDDQKSIQKLHDSPTPRVGGLALFCALIIGVVLWEPAGSGIKHDQVIPILIAALPIFLVGFWNDIFKNVSAKMRLLITAASALLAISTNNVSLVTLGFSLIDVFLANPLISIAFTAFAITGIVHAFNLVDGLNGLALGLAIIALSTLAKLSHTAGDEQLTHFIFIFIAILIGNMFFNFPFGKIFLGDSGAYLIGFLVAWMAVLLVLRNPAISPWAGLLSCSFPVIETITSIFRRLKDKRPVGEPDLGHLHSLVKLNLITKLKPNWPLYLRNSMATPIVWCLALMGPAGAWYFPQNTSALIGWFFGYFILYLVVYFVTKSIGRVQNK